MLQHQSGVVATETRRPQRRKYLLSGPSQRSLLRPDLKSLVRSRMFTNITLPSRHPLPNPLRQVPFCPISKLRSAAVGGAWRTSGALLPAGHQARSWKIRYQTRSSLCHPTHGCVPGEGHFTSLRPSVSRPLKMGEWQQLMFTHHSPRARLVLTLPKSFNHDSSMR